MSRPARPGDASRPWLSAGVLPPPPPRCDGCGAKDAPFGIGPPLRARLSHYCGACNQVQPETQRALAERARAVLEGE